MNDIGSELLIAQRLAVLHASRELRDHWALLLEFDNRLMTIAAKGQEPVLKQLRYAWWREQLAKDPENRPKGEPLLAKLANADRQTEIIDFMRTLIDAWELVVSEEDLQDAVLSKVADLRGGAIFESYARWTKASPDLSERAASAGKLWALATIGADFGKTPKLLPSALKPLNLLLMSSLLDRTDGRIKRILGSLRLNFHAATGL